MRLDFYLLIAAVVSSMSCADDPDSVGAMEPEAPALAAAEVITDVVVNQPLETPGRLIPCVNGGAGEVVAFSGVFSARFHLTRTGNRYVISTSGVIRLQGQGESTGNRYQFRDIFTQSEIQSSFNGQFSSTTSFTVLITGPGKGNGVRSRLTRHVSRNANGDITADVDNFRFEECR